MVEFAETRVIVVGGSIGGLTAALVLSDLGFDVQIVERTPEKLNGRGAGIVLQPDTVRWFADRSGISVDEVSTPSSRLRYIGADDEIVYEEPASWRFTSWNTIYNALLSDFGSDRYHLGQHFVGLDQDEDGVDLRFVSGRTEHADLVVFADGISSTARQRLLPEVAPQYAGYLGWRGTVIESEVSDKTFDLLNDSLSYALAPDSHINLYPIPGPEGELEIGKRQLNYVWYRNAPAGPALDEMLTDKRGFFCPVSIQPGMVQDRYVDELRDAAQVLLPPAIADLVVRTEQPFIQRVIDIEVPQMAFGRVALLGDAAFAARPHAAAGTAKAAADGWALGAALQAAHGDVVAALTSWQPGQLELGRNLVKRVQDMGRRSQVDGTWIPGDPSLLFGLYGPGR